jgi:hypothetical protein
MELSDIVELVEGRLTSANAYLRHGYRLISVQGVAGSGTHPDGKSVYVRRQVCYVLGRTAEVEHYDWMPQKSNRPQAAEVSS